MKTVSLTTREEVGECQFSVLRYRKASSVYCNLYNVINVITMGLSVRNIGVFPKQKENSVNSANSGTLDKSLKHQLGSI